MLLDDTEELSEVGIAGGASNGIGIGPEVELVFVPGDPPRSGMFVAYEPVAARKPSTRAASAKHKPSSESIELVFSSGNAVRRREVSAQSVSIADALTWLTQLDPARRGRRSVAAWADAVVAGLGILAKGRLVPAVTPQSWDAWRAGPFDMDDERLLEAIASSLPPSAHCVAVGTHSPIRMASPPYLVRALWDAMADTLVRTAAAPLIAGGDLFSAAKPQDATAIAGWLAQTDPGRHGEARVGIRIALDGATESGQELFDVADDVEGDDPEVRAGPVAVVQMTSSLDPSLVVDAGDLFYMPPAVLARLDPDAETNLLLTLRRGSRAWPPLGALLARRVPDAMPLTDENIEDLLSGGGDALRVAGIEVLWPSSLLTDGLSMRATMRSPTGADRSFSLEDMVQFEWRVALGGEVLSPEEIDQLAEAKRTIVRLRGRWIRIDPALLEKARRRRDRKVSAVEALGAVMAGEMLVDGETVAVTGEGPITGLAKHLRGISEATFTELGPPPGLVGELRPYQERGVAWLYQMCELGLGACLADDMGLGKTIQVIGLHLHRVASAGLQAGDRPRKPRKGVAVDRVNTLIICPTSLLGNWTRELGRFAPGIPVRRFHGSERSLDALQDGEVVVTTYGVVRRERDLLARAGFTLVVADEAQHAKNPFSDTARALRAVGGANRVALTGTPVENRLSELWSILDWTTPGLLGPLERFRTNVAAAIERRRDPQATERLSRTVRPFLLRRKKTDPEIAPDLPPRTVTDLPVALTPEQVTLYEAEVREAMDTIREKSGIERQGLVLRMMTVLKQICNHPAQYLHEPGPITGRSGKLAALEELLGVILEEGESVLVFSQFVELHKLLESRLAELGVRTSFLHGSVPVRQREEMVASFQSGAVPVFLLSLKAGGVGLNLTRATHVIHYDRWWNPAVEDQATDRAHRIGQDRPVQVHRLISEGTLEDRIGEMLERKRDLAETVVGTGEAWIADLSDDALADLVSLGSS